MLVRVHLLNELEHGLLKAADLHALITHFNLLLRTHVLLVQMLQESPFSLLFSILTSIELVLDLDHVFGLICGIFGPFFFLILVSNLLQVF
jgi:hypothetical protein